MTTTTMTSETLNNRQSARSDGHDSTLLGQPLENISTKGLTTPNITVVGSINCDFTTYMNAFPRQNETLMADNAYMTVGGKGLNQAIAAAKAGAKVSLIGCVGDDHFGEIAINYLKSNDVCVEHVYKIKSVGTGMASIWVNDNAQNMISVSPGANSSLSTEHIAAAKEVIENSDVVIGQLEVPIPAIQEAFDIAKNAGQCTILNPAPAHKDALGLLPLVDIFTPNETETADLSGVYPTDARSSSLAIEALQDLGAKTIIITQGSQGCSASVNNENFNVEAYKVDAIDPTGAGDVFNGVLAVSLAQRSKRLHQTLSIEDATFAIKRASAAAAISVTKAMAEGAAPSAKEITYFQENQKQ